MSKRKRGHPPSRGRTPGSTNREYEVARAAPTACPKCKSTERTPYRTKVEHAMRGEIDGRPYTHVVWRPTQCKGCGQWRKDKFYENRDAK